MKKINANLMVKEIKRGNNSYYGNPSYFVTVENENGETVTGRTASNAAIGYFLSYSHEGKKLNFDYHYTANGNLIFDYAKAI